MAKAKSRIVSESPIRKVTVCIILENKNKPSESSGILARVTNDVFDVLRKDFCAHQMKVVDYKEAKLPKRYSNPKIKLLIKPYKGDK